MAEKSWQLNYGLDDRDSFRMDDDNIIDIIANDANVEMDKQLFLTEVPLKTTTLLTNTLLNDPQSSKQINALSFKDRSLSPLNKFVSEYSIASFSKSTIPQLNDFYEETELTKELKTKVKAIEKRNLDLIIEVEKLKVELEKQRKLAAENTEDAFLKVNEKQAEIKNLKRFNSDLQKNVEEINKMLKERTSKLEESYISNKSLKEETKKLLHERDKLISELEVQKNENLSSERNCRQKEQELSYNELNLCRFESQNEILKEKLKFSENTTSDLTTKIEALKSELHNSRQFHKEENEKIKERIAQFRSDMESAKASRDGLLVKQATTLKKLSSSEQKNVSLQNKVDVLLEAKRKLSNQLDECKFNVKASRDELTSIRKELSCTCNKLKKTEEECRLMENRMKENTLVDKKIKDDCVKYEKTISELKHENFDLVKDKENLEIKLITLETSSECLKKDNLRLTEEVETLKDIEKGLRQKLENFERTEVVREAKLVNVEALNEILCGIYKQNSQYEKNASNLPDFWFKKETDWARKSDVIGKVSELEINKAENESQISNLLGMLSNYRDAFHVACASHGRRVSPPFEYVKTTNNPHVDLRKKDIFQRFAEFENLHRNVKLTYEEKHVLLRKQESFLKKEVDQLETALLTSRKNEVKLRQQLDATKTSIPYTPQGPQTSFKTLKLYESVLELEAQERRLKRKISELLFVEEYLVKNTNSFNAPGTEYYKRLPSERDPPFDPRPKVDNPQHERWIKPSRHPLDWIDLHATMSNDIYYQEAYMLEKTKQLKNREINLMKKLNSTEEECKKYQDKIIEDQGIIHNINIHSKELEISEKSLRQQLELAEEREAKLARKIFDLTEKTSSLETLLRSSRVHEEALSVEVSNFKAREEETHLQLTHAYDKLNDRIVEQANYKKQIKEMEDKMDRLESEVSTSKLVEDQLKKSLETSMESEANLKSKLNSKKHKLKLLKIDYGVKVEEFTKLEQSEQALKTNLKVREEEIKLLNDKIKVLEENCQESNSKYNSMLKLLEHHKQEFHLKLEEKKRDLDSTHKSCFEAKRDLIEKEKEIETLKQNIYEMRISNVQLKDSLDDYNQKVSEDTFRMTELEMSLSVHKEREQQLHDELQTTKDRLESSDKTSSDLKEKLLEEQKKFIQMESENEHFKVDLKILQEANKSLQDDIQCLNSKLKKKEAEFLQMEDQQQEEINQCLTKEDDLKRKIQELEATAQAEMVETLKNLNYNSKEIQTDFPLRSIILKLTSEDALYLIDNHQDFKRASNLLSKKYPQMFKDFMSDMKGLISGAKKWVEGRNDTNYLEETFFDLSPQKIKANPLYGRRLELDQINDTDIDDQATDQELSESGLSPLPTKTYPLQFAPSYHQTKPIGQAFHKFWPMPINEIKQDVHKNDNKDDVRSKKKATYQEEKTTYVRSRHLSTPAAPIFKTSYVDNHAQSPKLDDFKSFSKTPPTWKATISESQKQFLVLKESSVDNVDDDNDDEVGNVITNGDGMQDIFEENIVQKRIALFENKVSR